MATYPTDSSWTALKHLLVELVAGRTVSSMPLQLGRSVGSQTSNNCLYISGLKLTVATVVVGVEVDVDMAEVIVFPLKVGISLSSISHFHAR